jgi:hypothetical protein
MLSVLAVPGLALAAPCHDVVGTWQFELACIAATSPPHVDTISITGIVTQQEGCVFVGTLNGFPWVGALSGDGNRTVLTDHAGAKGTGELSARRGGLFREMSFAYTFGGFTAGPPTACTGVATRP